MLSRRGFTLIEVLVTLVILLFGLLGIAGLMAKGQRAAFEAFQRQQALSLAADMAERILGNRTEAAAYATGAPLATPLGVTNGTLYSDLLIGNVVNCAGATCTAADLRRYDLAMWEGLLLGYGENLVAGTGTRVGGVVNAHGCIEQLQTTQANCPAPPAAVGTRYTLMLRVSVAWQGSDATAAPTSSACGTGLYRAADATGTYVVSEAGRRVVSSDVNVLINCP